MIGNFDMVFVNLSRKIVEVASSTQGLIMALICTLAAIFADYELVLFTVLVVVIFDLGWGIAVSIHQGKFAKSELMRDTYSKVAVYGTVLLISMLCEKMVSEDSVMATRIIASGLIVTETWSILGNTMIIFPNLPFARLLRAALKGEIANKLGIEPDEVENALDGRKDNNTRKNSKQK